MATDATKILVGAGVVSIGDYVSGGGAGTLVDVGHTKAPITIAPAFTDYLVKSERAIGIIKQVPTDLVVTIKVDMMEGTLDHWLIAFRQPSANLSGTLPNMTLRVGIPVEVYHQVQI